MSKDYNYNKPGGRFGDKSKKKVPTTPQYRPTKAFNIIAGGVMLFFLAGIGLSIVGSIFTGIKDVIGVKDTVTNYTENIRSENRSITKTNGIDIDESDVQDILDYIYNSMSEAESLDCKTETLDYSDIDTNKKYKKNIINKLDKYDGTVTFIIVDNNTEGMSKEDGQKIVDNVKKIVSDNKELLRDTKYNSTETGGLIKSINDEICTAVYVTITFE